MSSAFRFPSGHALRRALLTAAALSLPACDASRPVGPGGVRQVAILLDGDTLRPGQPRLARAVATGRDGEVLDAAVTWRSLTPTTLAVGPTGQLVGLATGTGVVRASVGRITKERVVYLVNPPAVGFIVDPDTLRLQVPGVGTVPSVIPLDINGAPIIGAAITWSSEAPRIASVSAGGLVTPQAVGRTTLRIALDGVTRDLPALITAAGGASAPQIDSVRPTTLRPGLPFTVYGTRLGGTGATTVLVDGRSTQLTAGSETSVTALLPQADDACEPSGDVAVQVGTGGGISAATVRLELAPRRGLAVGEAALRLTAAEAACLELDGAARYLITVQHAARAIGAGSVALTLDLRSGADAVTTLSAGTTATRASGDSHLALLDRMRQFTPASGGGRIAEVQVPPLGGLVAVRVPDLDDARLCVAYRPIIARTVYNGSRIAILEDTTSMVGTTPLLTRQMDATIAELGAEVDAVTWPIVERFGNPLVMDDRLDANGKVVLVLSPQLNAMRGGEVMGAVVTCDFYPRGAAPASNVGEMLYLQVPDVPRYPTTGVALERWRAEVRGTIAHELKHVVGFAERLARGQLLEESWLEEATARHAEELFTRALTGATATGDAAYDVVRCESLALQGDPACAGTPYLMRPTFAGLYTFLAGPALHSPLGSIGGDASFYGSAWSLLRWSMDQAAVGEAEFVRALTLSGQAGIANLEGRAGRGWDEMLARWSLAVATDGRAGLPVADPRNRFPSWNLADLFAGYCRDLGACLGGDASVTFGRAHPLQAIAVSGDASVQMPEIVPAGFVAIEVAPAAPGSTRLLRLRGANGAPLPITARLAVLRIE